MDQNLLHRQPNTVLPISKIDPTNPNILYGECGALSGKPWTHRSGSEKGGVYKSIDGGRRGTN